MKRWFKIYIFLATALFTTSCVKETAVPPGVPEVKDERVSIELFTRLADPFRTPVSRAADETGVEKTPWVIVFSDNGTGVRENAVFAEASQAAVGWGNKSYVTLTPRTGKCWVLILANPQAQFYVGTTAYDFTGDNLKTVLTGKTLSQATGMLSAPPMADGTTVTTPVFEGRKLPMGYVSPTPINGINTSTRIGTSAAPLELTRIVSKLVVKSTAPDFTLLGIHSIENANNNTLLHNLSGNLPTPTKRVTYMKSNTATDFAGASGNVSEPVYLYEAKAGGDSDYTYMIIRGEYKGKQYFYKMAVYDDNYNYMDIRRNYQYEFTITGVNAPGLNTYGDAQIAMPSNKLMNYSVTITDENAYETVANGEYYLSVSNRLCLIYDKASNARYPVFTLTTNCTQNFSAESNYIRSTNSALRIDSPSSSRIPIAPNADSPVSVEVYVRLTGLATGDIELKLGNLELKVGIIKKDIIPASGAVLSYYDWRTTDGGWWNYDYYLSTGLVQSGSGITLSTTENKTFTEDPSRVTAEDGKINIHVGPSDDDVRRNARVWLTTIKNPKYPHGDDKDDIPRRIKVWIY